MKFSEFIKSVASSSGVSQNVTKQIVETTFNQIKDAIIDGDEIAIPRFGKFTSKIRASRSGVNPATGEKISIPETRSASFKPSKEFKEELN